MLNNDTEVTADWTAAPVAAFRDPTVGAVAPLVRRLPFRARIDSAGDDWYWFGLAKKRGETGPLPWLASFFKSPQGNPPPAFADQYCALEAWARDAQ